MLAGQVVTHAHVMLNACSHFQLASPSVLPVFVPPEAPPGARTKVFGMAPTSDPWDNTWCPKAGAYVSSSQAASSRDGWRQEPYGAPPLPPPAQPPGQVQRAVTLQSVPVSGALAGYSFTATAIDMINATEVGRSLLPIPVPDGMHEGELPPQPNFSAPVQDHSYVEPKYQTLPFGDGAYAYIPTYHERAQPGTAGTIYDTYFIDPSALPPVDFETPPVPVRDLHEDFVERIHDARYPLPGLVSLDGLATIPWYP